jgi:hypothetical protein
VKRHLPLLAALVLALVPYLAFFGPSVPFGRDLPYYFYPLKAHLVEAIRSGQVPWIDRFRWGGAPLLGAPGAAPFDPLNVLFLLLPLGTAMKTWMLVRLASGLVGFALFSRRRGASPAGAALAGLLFVLSGAFVSFLEFPGASAAFSFLPWFALALDRVLERPEPRRVAPLACVAALVLVAGAPEFVIHAVLLAPFLAARWLRRAALRRQLAALGGAALLAAGLAAPALVPGWRTGARSSRGPGGGMNDRVALAGALPVQRLPALLSDGAGGRGSASNGSDAMVNPYLPSITPGRVALLLGAVGLLAGRAAIPPLSAALAGLLLALGPAFPLWGLAVHLLPTLGVIRYPEKHLALFAFGWAWLAAAGIGWLEARLRPALFLPALALLGGATLLDREAVTRFLTQTAPPSVLARRPAILADVPVARADEPPPLLFHREVYLGNERTELFPYYGSLFGVGYQLDVDYDWTMPRQSFEWTRLLYEAVPTGNPVVLKLVRATGVGYVVENEGTVTRLRRFARPLPPFRFARRAVVDPDGRRLLRRVLDEGFEPGTAYLAAPRVPLPEALSPGRVLSVRDRADALTLSVEGDGPAPSFLMLYRRLDALEEATLDGRPLRVADLLFGFGGVVVPPGRHEIRLRPETGSVRIGALMSLVSALFLGLLTVRSRRPRGAACP